jgi:FhuF 2Fe-2S C-terminal domain
VASEADVAGAMEVAGSVGPFFVVEPRGVDGGWRRLDELVTAPALLVERVGVARAAIATRAGLPVASVEPRVAASIVFLGVSARLVSPALAATVLSGVIPRWTVTGLWWRPVPGGPWPLAAGTHPGPAGWRCDLQVAGGPDAAARWWAQTVLTGVVMPVLDAFEERFRVSRKVLLGNVASGLAGAVGMLAVARPAYAEAGAGLVGRILEHEPLRGTGELLRPSGTRPLFVRRSCCLFYRVPGAGTCGDCVLTAGVPRAGRRPADAGDDPPAG